MILCRRAFRRERRESVIAGRQFSGISTNSRVATRSRGAQFAVSILPTRASRDQLNVNVGSPPSPGRIAASAKIQPFPQCDGTLLRVERRLRILSPSTCSNGGRTHALRGHNPLNERRASSW